MTEFTPWSALLGGALIGLASAALLLMSGRIAGVSSITAGLLRLERGATGWRLAFLAGLVIGVWIYGALGGGLDEIRVTAGWPVIIIGGLLVGFGTQLGSGCTSGHGVCGLSRLSPRSIVATLLFMGGAGVTVYLVRHVLGGAT
jgi:uncharacterized membrane protein YedE/YeeE